MKRDRRKDTFKNCRHRERHRIRETQTKYATDSKHLRDVGVYSGGGLMV